MTCTIYLDEVLVGNLVMNFAILWLTARFSRFIPPVWRLVAAAALGAIYVVGVFLFPLAALSALPTKVALSLAMLLVAFGFLPWRSFGTTMVLFYLCSFGLGGLVFGMGYLLDPADWSSILDVPRRFFWPAVVFSLITVWAVGRVGKAFIRRRQIRGLFHVPVIITLYQKRLRLAALLDTGNQLSDPLSQAPVIVVELEAVEKLLPQPIRRLLSQQHEPDYTALLAAVQNTRWSTRFRLIPFSSLGRTHGLLLGFRPDEVEIVLGHERLRVRDVVVAIYQRRLAPEADYRALLNPRLLDAGPGILGGLIPN